MIHGLKTPVFPTTHQAGKQNMPPHSNSTALHKSLVGESLSFPIIIVVFLHRASSSNQHCGLKL